MAGSLEKSIKELENAYEKVQDFMQENEGQLTQIQYTDLVVIANEFKEAIRSIKVDCNLQTDDRIFIKE
ncbi:guanylate kinase [Evansella vedderi]|uniref:Guanylate kinase n=1 Tax=Evansella vedderi TaxID=38282 RepID=A0ABT9ZW54_9BACI|nr:hypothetical protein [Evansella vedderi]MDQ0255465.1 guanylate kinase [Evansella vedderi]